MVPRGLQMYGTLCGWTLARAHARSGDRIAIAAYLGGSDVFDKAMPNSLLPTPTRTSATSSRSSMRWPPGGLPPSAGCEIRPARSAVARGAGGGVVLDLLLIGLAITLEPFPVTAFILILSAEQGTRKGLAFILGWLACIVVVVAAVVLVTGGKPPAPSTAPSTAALVVKLAIGIVLIGFAVRQRRRMGRPRKPPTWMARLDRLSPWAAAGLAAFLQPWTLVAAGAATVTQAKLSSAADYLTLMLFSCWLPPASCTWSCTQFSHPPRPVPGLHACGSGWTPTGTR